MFDKLKNIFHSLRDKYFIEVAYVETDPNGPPTLNEKYFLVFDKDGNLEEYTSDASQATIVGYFLGNIIAKSMRAQLQKDGAANNLQISLVSASNQAFLDHVTGADKNYQNKNKFVWKEVTQPASTMSAEGNSLVEIANELGDKLLKSPDVLGIGVVGPKIIVGGNHINDGIHIEIGVKNPAAQNDVKEYIKLHDKYKNLPIEVIVTKQSHAL